MTLVQGAMQDQVPDHGIEPDRRTFLGQSLATLLVAGGATPGMAGSAAGRAPSVPAPKGLTLRFFPGFEAIRLETSSATINGVMGGSGPPVLLLQGFPETHVEWHKVAPALAKKFTVVATDLRGYGDSSKPADGTNHQGYSKRSTAIDQVEVMKQLGFHRFAVVGHDRGGRVAHRMALDHPDAVSRLAVLDIVPTHKLYSAVTKEFATAYYHWFFLIQPAPLPETLLGNNADFTLRNWSFRGLVPGVISEEVYAEYLRCFQDPSTLHAMCEDYRAAATIDLDHDKADLGVKVECPLLTLWGAKGAMHPLYDVLATWRERASHVQGEALPAGHWIPEQAPNELLAELLPFLSL
jgi:haloacetate dehalogenase